MITHPEKVLFPAHGITKGELLVYYESVADVMLPHVRGRPVTMERFPAGIDQKGFMQKDVAKGFPEWLTRVEVRKKSGTVHHALVDDARSLSWLANQNCITPHVWTSRVPHLEHPDLCVFDLDPATENADALRAATLAVRDVLRELGLRSWVKTSGSKGFHVVVPLDGTTGFDAVWDFALGVGALLVKREPEGLTQEFIKLDRAGRILVDTGRNAYAATIAAPYAVRAKPDAPVSTPCTWDEVERASVQPTTFTLRTMRARLADVGDVWADLLGSGQSLDAALTTLRDLLTEADWQEAHAASSRKPGPRTRRT